MRRCVPDPDPRAFTISFERNPGHTPRLPYINTLITRHFRMVSPASKIFTGSEYHLFHIHLFNDGVYVVEFGKP